MTLHDDRRRAESFGAAAQQYDAFRPRYPADLIAGLIPRAGARVLDVGAGTGIASRQLAEAGGDVTAVEPDPEMARIAAAKDLTVEVATFEAWEPAGRRFDLVVFAQSFHWVEPRAALGKVAGLLNPGGSLALLWNRITPATPALEQFDEAYAGLIDDWRRPSVRTEDTSVLAPVLDETGFDFERRVVHEQLHYSGDDWVNMVTTYSNALTLDPADRASLRARLGEVIDRDGVGGGVDALNDSLAVVCTLR